MKEGWAPASHLITAGRLVPFPLIRSDVRLNQPSVLLYHTWGRDNVSARSIVTILHGHLNCYERNIAANLHDPLLQYRVCLTFKSTGWRRNRGFEAGLPFGRQSTFSVHLVLDQ